VSDERGADLLLRVGVPESHRLVIAGGREAAAVSMPTRAMPACGL
jgi:hypothetical protein